MTIAMGFDGKGRLEDFPVEEIEIGDTFILAATFSSADPRASKVWLRIPGKADNGILAICICGSGRVSYGCTMSWATGTPVYRVLVKASWSHV